MKPGTRTNCWLLALACLFGATLHAQQVDPSYQVAWPAVTGSGAPVFPCTSTNYGEPYTDVTSNIQYHCGSAGWFSSAAGGNTTSSMTAGYVPKATGANSIGNSSLQDNGTTLSTSEPIVGGASVSTTPGSTNAVLDLPSVGTLPGQPTANTIRVTSPNSTSSYVLVFPGAYPTSGNPFISCTNANPSICSWASNSVNWASPGAIGGTTPNSAIFTALSAQHLIGTTGAPTYTADAGAGTGPTVSVLSGSTDLSGWVQATIGTSPTASAGIVTLHFNVAFTSAPKCWVEPANGAAAALSGTSQPYVAEGTTTTSLFVITGGSTALTASTTYLWEYGCTQ